MGRGALIVLEGVDRSGKSTQTVKLAESLNKENIKAERISFPDRTTGIGKIISNYLSDKNYAVNDETIHLLFSANRWESVDKMNKLLQSGVTLIVDRYSYSGVVFSTAKGLDFNWCMQPEIGLPKPDLVFLLNAKPEDLKDRPGYGGERYETVNMQKKAADIFNQFPQTEDDWVVVNAGKPFEEVHKEILEIIKEKIKEMENFSRPLDRIGSNGKENGHQNGDQVTPSKRLKVSQ